MLKNDYFAGILKVNDENRLIRIQNPDPDPSLRGMDTRIRIRINPQMSWIRNTAQHIKTEKLWYLLNPLHLWKITFTRIVRMGIPTEAVLVVVSLPKQDNYTTYQYKSAAVTKNQME